MNRGSIIRQIEEMNEYEYHQFLAGCDRHVKLVANQLRKRKAEAERKIELGEQDVTE